MLADSLGFPLEALGVPQRRGQEGPDEQTGKRASAAARPSEGWTGLW